MPPTKLLTASGNAIQTRPSESVARPAVIPTRAVKPLLAEDSVWLDLWSFARRNYRLLLCSLALGFLAAYLATISARPAYRATAAIEIQNLNENFLNLREVSQVSSMTSNSGTPDVATQIRILESNSLIGKVLKQLPAEKVPPPTGLRSVMARFRGPRTAVEPGSDASIEAAHQQLQVRNTRQSHIVDLVYESPDPVYAAAFVNRIAQEYIDQSVESRVEASRSTSVWLEKQLAEMRGTLADSEKRLQEYARETGLLVTTEDHRPDEEKLRQIQESLSKAQENRMMKQARMETAANSPLEAIEVPVGNALRDHQAKVADLRRQRADLMTVYTPDFAGVKRLDSQIASLETSLRNESKTVLQGIRNDYDDAVRREGLLQEGYRNQVGQVTQQAGIAIQYGILKREADTSREIYKTMLQRSAEAKVASALHASTARLVDGANPPSRPFSPNAILNLAWGATAGLLLGLVLGMARDRSDRQVTQPGDLALRLNLAELGSVPPVRPVALTAISESALTRLSGKTDPLEGVALETWNNRSGPAAASYRAVLTSILFSQEAGRSPQVIVVTSASKGEGKTALIVNLAAAIAQTKQTVLLVDASTDCRLQKVFHHSNDCGLLDLLEEHGENSDLLPYVTHPTPIQGVDLVMTGSADRSALDMLYAEGMGMMIEQMRRAYDVVLIDTPALSESPDARVLGRMGEGVVLVVRAGESLDSAQAVAARLQEDGTVVLGTVLNHIA